MTLGRLEYVLALIAKLFIKKSLTQTESSKLFQTMIPPFYRLSQFFFNTLHALAYTFEMNCLWKVFNYHECTYDCLNFELE